MKMSNKLYDVLKYICTIALPALVTFLGIVLAVLGVQDNVITIILTILSATATFIGTLIGISNANYKKEMNSGKITITAYTEKGTNDNDDGN